MPGREGEVDFRVLVKAVKEKVLPEVTDEWASEVSEFDTVEELKTDLVTRIGGVRKANAQMSLRAGTAQALAELVVDDVPEALIDGEVQRRVEDLAHRLSHQGATLQQWLEATGQTPEDFIAAHRADAVGNVKVDLALRAVVGGRGHRAFPTRNSTKNSRRSPPAPTRSRPSYANSWRPTARCRWSSST